MEKQLIWTAVITGAKSITSKVGGELDSGRSSNSIWTYWSLLTPVGGQPDTVRLGVMQ